MFFALYCLLSEVLFPSINVGDMLPVRKTVWVRTLPDVLGIIHEHVGEDSKKDEIPLLNGK